MTKDSPNKYTRTIRLAPALGDWTHLSSADVAQTPIKIQHVQSARFDSLRKESFQAAHMIHYRLGEAMCHKLSKDMDIKIELHSVSATQIPYVHFMKSMETQLIQADLVAPTGDRINVILDWPLAEQMIDRLTGGSGLASSSDEFSAIEAGILETQMQEILDLLPSVWKHAWEFKNLIFEFNAGQYLANKKVSDRDAVVVFEYQILLGQGELREIRIAYPNLLLRKMLENYEIATQYITPTISLNETTMQRIKVPAKVVLGDAQIAMNDLRDLQVGDILRLESSITDPLKLVIGNTTELTVQPGIIDDQFCAQILLWDTPSDSKKRPPVTHYHQASTPPPPPSSVASISSTAAAVAATSAAAIAVAPAIVAPTAPVEDAAIDDLFGSDFNLAPIPDDSDDLHAMDSHPFEDDEDEVEKHDDTDDDFESDDIFSEDYGLDEDSSPTPSAPATNADDDEDDFSWDDLEDEL